MTAPLYLGVDLGTSGVRSAVVDAQGREVASARAPYPHPVAFEMDARDWFVAVSDCLDAQADALRAQGLSPQSVAAIAVDGTSGSMTLVDARLEPVTPALMYHSSGFEPEAARLARHAPRDSIARGAGSGLARLLRLQALDRDGRAVALCHQADYVVARLRGASGVSDENNALKTGYDPQARRWPDWMAAAGARVALLPRVLAVGAAIGPIAPATAARFGLAPTTLLRAGATDSVAAFLASGVTEIGGAVTSLGTTLAIKLMSDRRIDAPELGVYSHRLGARWLVGGASNSGAGVLLDHFEPARIAELSRLIDPSRDSGLDYYPLSRPGERFPVNDPALTARLTPRPSDDLTFLHGLLEGVARIEARGYAVLRERGAPAPTRVVTAGGGARNPVWTAMRQRLLGIPVENARATEAAVGMAELCRSAATT